MRVLSLAGVVALALLWTQHASAATEKDLENVPPTRTIKLEDETRQPFTLLQWDFGKEHFFFLNNGKGQTVEKMVTDSVMKFPGAYREERRDVLIQAADVAGGLPIYETRTRKIELRPAMVQYGQGNDAALTIEEGEKPSAIVGKKLFKVLPSPPPPDVPLDQLKDANPKVEFALGMVRKAPLLQVIRLKDDDKHLLLYVWMLNERPYLALVEGENVRVKILALARETIPAVYEYRTRKAGAPAGVDADGKPQFAFKDENYKLLVTPESFRYHNLKPPPPVFVEPGRKVEIGGKTYAIEPDPAKTVADGRPAAGGNPARGYTLKDENGQALILFRYDEGNIHRFELTEQRTGKIREQMVTDTVLQQVPVFRDEEYRVLVRPAELDNDGRQKPAIYETRVRQVTVSPLTMIYQKANETLVTVRESASPQVTIRNVTYTADGVQLPPETPLTKVVDNDPETEFALIELMKEQPRNVYKLNGPDGQHYMFYVWNTNRKFQFALVNENTLVKKIQLLAEERIPPVYKNEQYRVLVRPEQIINGETIPGVYETRTRKVAVDPGVSVFHGKAANQVSIHASKIVIAGEVYSIVREMPGEVTAEKLKDPDPASVFGLDTVAGARPTATHPLSDDAGREYTLFVWRLNQRWYFVLAEGENVRKKAIANSLDMVPGVFETRIRKVVVAPARKGEDGERIPPVYKDEEYKVCVQPETQSYDGPQGKIIIRPGSYEVGIANVPYRIKRTEAAPAPELVAPPPPRLARPPQPVKPPKAPEDQF